MLLTSTQDPSLVWLVCLLCVICVKVSKILIYEFTASSQSLIYVKKCKNVPKKSVPEMCFPGVDIGRFAADIRKSPGRSS